MAGAGLMTYQAKEVLNKVLNTSNDSLQVDIIDATGVSITATSGAEYADDAAFTLGSDKGTMIMGFAGTQSVNANDAAALACDTDGALHIADGGNSITIDGTVTADLGTTDNAVLDAIAASLALLDNSIPSGSELQVDVVAAIPAGDNNIGNVDIVTLPASTNTIEVVGDAAENAAAAGNPVLVGGRYDSSARTLGDGDAGAIALDADGAVHVTDGGNAITVDGSVTADLGSNNDVRIESGQVKSGAIASGAIASGAVASGAVASGAIASGAVVDGAVVTLGAKADAKSTATDTTSITAMQVLKQISASVQETATDTGTIDSDTDAIKTAVELIDDAIFVDDAAFTLGSSKGVMMMGFAGAQAVNANDAAALACGTDGSLLTTHSVTGIVDGVKTVTTYGTDVALVGSSTPCKKVDIQAQTDNTGVIAVGATGVDATVATGTGIILNAGDVYSLEVEDLEDIYIDSLENGEGVRFTYFT